MFHGYFDLVENKLKNVLGENTEFFHDIHCADPFDKKNEYLFPVVALNSNGLCLALLENGSEGASDDVCGRLEYACRVFRSYFFTKMPVRIVFVFRMSGRFNLCPEFMIYDPASKDLRSCFLEADTDFGSYFQGPLQDGGDSLQGSDRDDLANRLLTESSEPLMGDSEDKFCYVKRGGKWYPAFHKDGDTAFYLALFGGLFGLHRFYLGLPGSGLLYLATFGIFGVGWLFDCIEILVGCWNHKGIFLLPLKNRATSTVLFFLVVAAVAVAFLLF